MNNKPLSKTRFKLGLECANKLYYVDKKQYVNQKQDDPFLQALAQGGFQVEELARLHYPGGTLIEGNDWKYSYLHELTQNLLKEDNATVYEAAFLHEDLFIRTDILEKKGNHIKVIEVKAKSIDPRDEFTFVGKQGGLVSGWKAYLFDLAFQTFVIKQVYPGMKVTSHLMLADKTKKASIDGLNQLFRISNQKNNRTGIEKRVSSLEETGDSILSEVDLTELINSIIDGVHLYEGRLRFIDAVNNFREWYKSGSFAGQDVTYSACKNCEFKGADENDSGFHRCFKLKRGFSKEQLEKPSIFEIWNFKGGKKLFEDKFFMDEVNEDDVKLKPEADGLSTTHRRWVQIEKTVNHESEPYVDIEGLKDNFESWKFPLHFIDFETSTVALPFVKGMAPYEQTAFQFSHHIVHKDGTIEHASEYLHAEPGSFPNFEFVRALKKALSNDDGTIFRYHNHENTVMNQIKVQLEKSSEHDKDELIQFIKSISHSTGKSASKWKGERDMVDLYDIILKYYYNPLMKGSNSIKDVLPAVLNSSELLKSKYTRPIGELPLTSKNFDSHHKWIEFDEGKILSPYKTLDPIFDDLDEEQLELMLSDLDDISNGGAALTAYSFLQYTDMSAEERGRLEKGLLKYCELDTLSMVFIYEHFNELIKN